MIRFYNKPSAWYSENVLRNRISQLEIDGLAIEVTQKRMKHIRIGIFPPMGTVRVSAPLHYPTEQIQKSLLPKLAWMKAQRELFLKRQNAHPKIEQALYILGKLYSLELVPPKDPRCFSLQEIPRVFYLPDDLSVEKRKEKINHWRKKEFTRHIEPMLLSWSLTLKVKANSWSVRQMKTKWGSCNITDRKIVFNLELFKHSSRCIEYVVAHELIHLIEPSHNERFKKFMTAAIPEWKVLKKQLQEIPVETI